MKHLVRFAAALVISAAACVAELLPGHVFFPPPGGVGSDGAIEFTNANPQSVATKSFVLPVESMRGVLVFVSADVQAKNVSAKPQPWNGIKLMVKVEMPGRTDWPQPDIPVGTFDSQHLFTRIMIPTDATAVTLTLGLEKVTGSVRFKHVKVTLGRVLKPPPSAPVDQPIFRGHDLPRLRGAMVSPRMGEADLAVLSDRWGANLIRWQLIRSNSEKESYDQWLDSLLARTDTVLEWAKAHGVKVVLDLHSPPSGKASPGGYVAAMGQIFTQPEAQRHFVDVWRKIALRYRGNTLIWGFDLMNEPVEDQTAEGCQDWQDLALTAGKAVQEIDPARILIIEPPRWGGPSGWVGFNPLPLPRVVYSFHMYEPGAFTHQRVFNKNQQTVAYPGEIDGQAWNRDRLIKTMQPAIDFARRYRVHIYVGEFSAIRWAPGADRYLADLTSVFEEQGWDWTYHAFREWPGWSLEYGSDEKSTQPAIQPTERFKIIERWLKQNQRAGER